MAKLNDIDVDEYLAQCTQVEPLALQEEFVRWSGDYAYWNEKLAKASRLHASCKLEREKIYSRLTLEARAMAGTSKTTVAEIEAKVMADPAYQTAREAETDAEVETERISGVLQALRGKKDMLVQLGYHQRAEMAGDPTLREYMRDQTRGG